MTLEKQVVSQELAKKLKTLGVKQESCFMWMQTGVGGQFSIETYSYDFNGEEYSAYSVAELGEMLKISDHLKYGLNVEGKWWVTYERIVMMNITETYTDTRKFFVSFICDTEADARAKMLIYLIENKLIKI